MMNFEQFKTVFEALKECADTQNKYLENVPSDLKEAVFDNGYTVAQSVAMTKILRCTLGTYLASEIDWFLYDFIPGTVETETNTYNIQNEADFLSYINSEYFDD